LRRLVVLSQLALHAQAAAAALEFDVTSVRAFRPQPGQRAVTGPSCTGGRFVFSGAVLRPILWAYRIEDFQLFELPKWASSADEYFAIEAKASSAIMEDECRLMAQRLLADRFKLAVHRETREIPVYALVVGKNGIKKMKRATDSDEGLGGRITINGSPFQNALPPGTHGTSMEKLASILGGIIGLGLAPGEPQRPVIDKTGLEGLYRFSLDVGLGIRGTPPPDGFSDVFGSLREQLGLELQKRTESYDTVVIDHLEGADAN
jgi:uncharacterized protein (TIGR03435 family)